LGQTERGCEGSNVSVGGDG